MKALKIITVLGMAVLVAAVQPSEAGVRKSGLTGAAFLKIGVGARAAPPAALPGPSRILV